jgi:hypothetical protein
MFIMGVDYHLSFQQVAFLNQDTTCSRTITQLGVVRAILDFPVPGV